MTPVEFLTDLFDRRTCRGGYEETVQFLRLHGAHVIEPTAYEPDPNTYRHGYYYNAVDNAVYRRVIDYQAPGVTVAHWRRMI
jgi:hypothetical protein